MDVGRMNDLGTQNSKFYVEDPYPASLPARRVIR